ncbi:zinc finger protein 62-like [Sitodiplosis mosellana]|uniref:zinc finger protein 62-like n=1 Tax=Sitodiplosis mosellana TaxID=263140 RepID=UPI002444D59D|nr:zinc finger protein 62-like [Sitodiplosis mosellana]
METSDDEIIIRYTEQNERELIERKKHELILRKYRLNTQRLIKEYQTKIQQQNRQIEMLMKEVKRQKFIIDTFANVNMETVDISTQSERSNENAKIEIDSELEAIFYSNNKTKQSDRENANEKHVNLCNSPSQRERLDTKTMGHKIERIDIERKKSSLVSIEIQPNIQPKINSSTNVYICDECNKAMSSRRVLAKHKRMVHCLQKEFICDHCSKAFCTRDGLKRHLRIHTGEKPFVCRGCQKGFNQSGNMRIHEKTCKKYLRLNG